ncbi:MAG: hypothetical protein M1821_006638 [Bathelium mastoideum]|nr:MAG: hypothetical protein M1821_006638 [Bathelium mastoideum]
MSMRDVFLMRAAAGRPLPSTVCKIRGGSPVLRRQTGSQVLSGACTGWSAEPGTFPALKSMRLDPLCRTLMRGRPLHRVTIPGAGSAVAWTMSGIEWDLLYPVCWEKRMSLDRAQLWTWVGARAESEEARLGGSKAKKHTPSASYLTTE